MVVARLISRVIDLITMIVLARLLQPADFGLVAIAMTVIYIVEATLELPLSQALVRLPRIEPAHVDTAFTLGMLRGLGLCVIVCAVSIPFAHVYADPRLVPLICSLGLAPAARGLLNPRMAQFAKDVNFKWEFLFEFCGKMTAFIVGLAIALTTGSYWALAAGTIAGPLVIAVMSYCVMPYRPRLTLSAWHVFADFLGWFSAAQIISAINWQSDRLMLGRLMPRAQLGMFSTANDMASIPMLAIFSPILRPLLSAFSALQHDHAKLVGSYRVSSNAIVTIGLPLILGESLMAGPIIRLLLGDKWLGAIPILQWLSLSLVPTLFAVPLLPLAMSRNQTKMLVVRNGFELCVKLPCVIFGAIQFGFAGVIGARVISELAVAIWCMVIVRRMIALPVLAQIFISWRSFVASAGMGAVVLACKPWVAGLPGLPGRIVELAVPSAAGGLCYAALLLLAWALSGRPAGMEARIVGMLSRFLPRRAAAA